MAPIVPPSQSMVLVTSAAWIVPPETDPTLGGRFFREAATNRSRRLLSVASGVTACAVAMSATGLAAFVKAVAFAVKMLVMRAAILVVSIPDVGVTSVRAEVLQAGWTRGGWAWCGAGKRSRSHSFRRGRTRTRVQPSAKATVSPTDCTSCNANASSRLNCPVTSGITSAMGS